MATIQQRRPTPEGFVPLPTRYKTAPATSDIFSFFIPEEGVHIPSSTLPRRCTSSSVSNHRSPTSSRTVSTASWHSSLTSVSETVDEHVYRFRPTLQTAHLTLTLLRRDDATDLHFYRSLISPSSSHGDLREAASSEPVDASWYSSLPCPSLLGGRKASGPCIYLIRDGAGCPDGTRVGYVSFAYRGGGAAGPNNGPEILFRVLRQSLGCEKQYAEEATEEMWRYLMEDVGVELGGAL